MELVLDAIKLGLFLAVLPGPILFSLIQTGVEEGAKAGLTLGSGIWISDVLFILFVYFGMTYAAEVVQNHSFILWSGIIGAIILIGFGIGIIITKAPFFDNGNASKRYSSYNSLFTKGFLINTVNPFTVFFWFGVMSTFVLAQKLNQNQAFLFFGIILFIIVFTDAMKVLLSKRIRKFLKPVHVTWVRKITGALLIVFGIALVFRVFMLPVG